MTDDKQQPKTCGDTTGLSAPVLGERHSSSPAGDVVYQESNVVAESETLVDANQHDQEFPEVSIVMPCLNEAETIAICIREAQTAMDRAGLVGEVVIADNGSTDASREIGRSLGARVIDVAEKGYGSALRAGIAAATGRYIVFGDADASYDFGDIPRFVESLRAGHDLVIGNRFRGGIQPGAMPWLHRYIGNPVLSGIGRLFFKCPARDFHCGLRGFSTRAFAAMQLTTTGMEFASEMVIKATLKGLRITEIPTVLRPDGRSRPPHLRSWRDGWRHLRFMLLFSPRWLFLLPGLVLMTVGLVALTALAIQPIRIGGAVFDIHSLLLSAVCLIAGYQTIQLAMFARAFSSRMELLPPSKWLHRLQQHLSLETGVLIGAILLMLGTGGILFEAATWVRGGFGELDARQTMRHMIPAVVAVMIGLQTIFGSFFLSLLSLIPGRR